MRYKNDFTVSTAPAPLFRPRTIRFMLSTATALGVSLAAHVASAQTSFAPVTPTGLNPGDHYRLAFLTDGTIDATATDIATYNAFVTAAAGSNPLLPTTTWSAIASTATTSAVSNIACAGCDSDPIFLVTGAEVGASSASLFDGQFPSSTGTQLTPIDVTESGVNTGFGYVWTGSSADGTNSAGEGLGQVTDPIVGFANADQYGDGIDVVTLPASFEASLYAISGDLTVNAVPEPASASLFGLGALATALAARRRRRS